MQTAVTRLQEGRKRTDDEFDAFGRYIAHELRSLNNAEAAQRIRFRVARCLMDSIEAEYAPQYVYIQAQPIPENSNVSSEMNVSNDNVEQN